MTDISGQLQQQVADAAGRGQALEIVGGRSKAFYGRPVNGESLELAGHRGIISYEPTELVIRARAGTPLREIEATLAEQNQMLGFDPPAYADSATIGGTVAGNFSGPRRAARGAARDFLLGCTLINGQGELLAFGGQVMKNVAGYDVSRLMAGSLGTLGVLLDVSLMVIPRPEKELTLVQQCGAEEALKTMHAVAGRPLPLSSSCYDGRHLWLRVEGNENAVAAAAREVGGDIADDGGRFWSDLREQRLGFFTGAPLWRLSLASNLPPLASLPGQWLYEWGGALRWLRGAPDPDSVFQLAREFTGHATLFRSDGDDDGRRFQPLSPALLALHRRLKQAFDPRGILNPGRIAGEL